MRDIPSGPHSTEALTLKLAPVRLEFPGPFQQEATWPKGLCSWRDNELTLCLGSHPSQRSRGGCYTEQSLENRQDFLPSCLERPPAPHSC